VRTPVNRVGQRFGRLLVVRDVGRLSRGEIKWHCACDCGGVRIVRTSDLTGSREITSCGCGEKTNTYKIWCGMIARCQSPGSARFAKYGGQGITVCDEWRKYENFARDMGSRPGGATLDRIDNALGYSKENCRWATVSEQNRNKKKTLMLEYCGHRKSLVDFCNLYGTPYPTARRRYLQGWSADEVIFGRERAFQMRQGPRITIGASQFWEAVKVCESWQAQLDGASVLAGELAKKLGLGESK
jgi:hypothetical protein